MTYQKTIIFHVFILLSTLFLASCGGDSSSGISTDTDNVNTVTTDRPVFNRALASRAPNFSPSGNISDTTPTFTWAATQDASQYILGHEDTDSVVNWTQYTISSVEALCSDNCEFTPKDFTFSVGDEKVWWVRANVNGVWQDWSKGHIFEVIASSNNNTNPETLSPSGENTAINPEFSWTAVATASRYQFGYENPSNESNWQSYTLSTSESNCTDEVNNCSYTPTDSGLTAGDVRRWWVRAETNGVWGEWSEGANFTIAQNTSSERPFIITVKGYETERPPIIILKDFIIRTDPRYSYNYNVDCDSDGILEATDISEDYTCVFDDQLPNFGEHSISISGQFPAFLSATPKMIINIEQWGTQPWITMERAFSSSGLLKMTATDSPDLSQVSSMKEMFLGSQFPLNSANGSDSLANWDVSNITNMSGMFNAARTANPDISGWDVSNVTDMSKMFRVAEAFNQDISNWDVSNVVNMNQLFSGAKIFNQNIGNWNVSSVTNMGSMLGSTAFNQDIGRWDVSNVTKMDSLFFGASSFNQDIGNWDVSNVTTMFDMFGRAESFNQEIGNWDVSNVSRLGMCSMFSNAKSFNQYIGNWDVSNVDCMSSMFSGAVAFNKDISQWNVSNVTNMRAMFSDAESFNQNIGNWDVSNVTDMGIMFEDAKIFNQDIGNWNVSNVTSMNRMFNNATMFNQDIGDWNVSNNEFFTSMFKNALSFNQDLSSWDISNAIRVDGMFEGTTLSPDNYPSGLSF